MNKRNTAFTLAELLIALGILGMIATFTIPKVLQAQQNSKFNATAKEAASMIAGAFSAYQSGSSIAGSTGPKDLTPFMNYVAVVNDGSLVIDDYPTKNSFACSGHFVCLVLHNGAILEYGDNMTFGGTASTNAIFFYLDPDGKYSNSTSTPGKSLVLFMYPNGRITSYAGILSNTYTDFQGGLPNNPNAAFEPDWFSWQD
jgi:prepilin-type N-terminal cleavage/methylation domain-containing protein